MVISQMELALASDHCALGMTGGEDVLPSSWPGPACQGPCLLSKLCTRNQPGLPMPFLPAAPMQASGLRPATYSGLSMSKRQQIMDMMKSKSAKWEFEIHMDVLLIWSAQPVGGMSWVVCTGAKPVVRSEVHRAATS